MPAASAFAFGPFRLDLRTKQLFRNGEPEGLPPKHFDVLSELVRHAGRIVSKDRLIEVAWHGEAVSDNSLEKLMGLLRQRLDPDDSDAYIKTEPRRGYRFVGSMREEDGRPSDADLDAMMAPHTALMDGRALIESLDRARIDEARVVFERLLAGDAANARMHVGLANVYAWRFEATRADAEPDVASLRRALMHADEARRLNPHLSEAWATFGFVVERTGDRPRALAALRHAVSLESDNWRHHLRLAYAAWGEERLRAARRTLELYPGLAVAHVLAATVFVARGALALAERELDSVLGARTDSVPVTTTFSWVAVHWLKGLLCLVRGADEEAVAHFDRELTLEVHGHLYARECCANAWYAKGVCAYWRGDLDAATAALGEALARVPQHPMAKVALACLTEPQSGLGAISSAAPSLVDAAVALAAWLVAGGRVADAVTCVSDALAQVPPGSGGWTIPIEPMLGVARAKERWSAPLSQLAERAR